MASYFFFRGVNVSGLLFVWMDGWVYLKSGLI